MPGGSDERNQRGAGGSGQATAPALSAGRQNITGRIVAVIWRPDERYGDVHDPRCQDCNPDRPDRYCRNVGTWKMIVETAEGNRVWMNVPRALNGAGQSWDYENNRPSADPAWSHYIGTVEEAKAREGLEVVFSAEVEPKELHFGFVSRPAKFRVIGQSATVAA